MLQKLLWCEVGLKGGVGLLLVLAPVRLAALLGLPSATAAFWPRLLGGLLLGLTAAMLVQGLFPNVRTLTPAGLIAINVTTGIVLAGLLMLAKAATTRRGRLLLWALVLALAALVSFEIAYA